MAAMAWSLTNYSMPLNSNPVAPLRSAYTAKLFRSRSYQSKNHWGFAAGSGIRPPRATIHPSDTSVEPPSIGKSNGIYTWQGHNIEYMKAGNGELAVVLVHGFGASIGHWRRNIPVLSETYTVYALDLIGQGASDKPADFQYTIESWAQLISDFLRDVVASPSVLVGNSIGSLCVLTASATSQSELVKGVTLLNCAGGMNNKAVVDDWRVRLAYPLFLLVDFLLRQPAIASWIFNKIRNPERIKSILQGVYSNKEAVDDELVQIILKPADSEGALPAFVSILIGPPGPRPETLLPLVGCPVLVLWGDEDPFTPIDGPVGKFFRLAQETSPLVSFVELAGVGHCPHDDNPQTVHRYLLPWLASL